MRFVLCHGGWQGGWCWDEVVSQLKLRGQSAYAPTLRGSEAGKVNRAGITLQDIADGLATFLLERDLNDSMLVGHSGGGPVVQLLADRLPERVHRVMFVDAWVLLDGETIFDMGTKGRDMALAQRSPDATIAMDLDVWKATFMNDATPEQLEAVTPRLVPCPIGWFNQPIHLPRFYTLQIPSSYIFLRQDRSMPKKKYQQMAQRLTNPKIVECDGSHEAMLTRPVELAEALITASF